MAVAATSILCSRSSSLFSSATASRTEESNCTSCVNFSEIPASALESSRPGARKTFTTPSTGDAIHALADFGFARYGLLRLL